MHANYYQSVFLRQYRDLQLQIAAAPLGVLVWGPGTSAGDLYEKRLQIRNVLRKQGYMAVFSEEIDEKRPTVNLSANTRELLQALAADFIVVIYGSPGAIAETHDFATYLHEIGSKMIVFIDERYNTGYGYTGTLRELNGLYQNATPTNIRTTSGIATCSAKWRNDSACFGSPCGERG